MRRAKSMAGMCGLLLAMSFMSRQPVRAQQSPAPGEPETAELRRRVQELEDRLGKLEAERAAQTTTAAVSENVSLGSAKSPKAEAAKPAEPDDSSKSQDGDFLDFFRKVEVSGFIDGYYS